MTMMRKPVLYSLLVVLTLLAVSPFAFAREPNSGVYGIWLGSRSSYLDSPYVKGGQAVENWADVDSAFESPNVGNWGPMDADMKVFHDKSMSATIQINGNNKPDYLFNKVPYNPTKLDTVNDSQGTLMYWHQTHKDTYHELLADMRNHMVGMGASTNYLSNIIGIRMNFNLVGTEHSTIPSTMNDWAEGWIQPAGCSSRGSWPWIGSYADQCQQYVEDAYANHVAPDIFVFCRTNDYGNIMADYPAKVTNGQFGWFWTSSEAEVRSANMATMAQNTYDQYCVPGTTRGYAESWADAYGFHAGKWDDVLENGKIHWCSPAQFFYWRCLQDLNFGVSYVGVYGDDLQVAINGTYNRSYPVGYAYPKWRTGDVSAYYQDDFKAALNFVNKYAGYHADPTHSPGAWVAFRTGNAKPGDYHFLMERVGTDGTTAPASRTTVGSDDDRFGAFARKLPAGNTMKLLADGTFASSLSSNDAKIQVRYLNANAAGGTLTLYAGGQSKSVNVSNDGSWGLLELQVSGTSFAAQDYGSGAQIKLTATGSQITLHMVEVQRAAASTEPLPDSFTRQPLWSNTDTDSIYNSGYNANNNGVTGNVWKYDYVSSGGNLASGNPWYKQAATALTWNATNSYWDIGSSTTPRVDSTGVVHSNADVNNYANIARAVWTAPQEGYVNISGALSLGFWQDSTAKTSEWVIARKASSTWTVLASGSKSISAGEASGGTITKTIDLAYANYPRLTKIALHPGDQIIWSQRITATGRTNGVRLVDNAMDFSFVPATCDFSAPADVSNFSAVAGSNLDISLTWSNPGSDFQGVLIKRSTTGAPSDPYGNDTTVYDGNDTSFVDSGLQYNVTYFYQAFAHDSWPNYAAGTGSGATAIDGRNLPPAAPIGLAGSADASVNAQVLLSWRANTEPDLAGYNVYRSTVWGSNYVKVNTATVSLPAFTDSGVQDNTTYYYVVTAYDNATPSLESAYSNQVTVNVPVDTQSPAAPTNLTATAGNAQVALDWNDNTEQDFVGYNLCRSTVAGGPYDLISNVTSSNYTDTTVTNGTMYYYVVTASDDAANESANSTEVSAKPVDPTLPGPVLNFTASPSDGQVVLNWTNPTDPDFSVVQIQRKTTGFPTSPTDGWTGYNANGTSWTNGSLANGTTYYYTAWAKDTTGNYSLVGATEACTPGVNIVTLYSVGSEDGFIQESGQTTEVGGSINVGGTGEQGTRVGDVGSGNCQYKSIYSFDTSSLPDGATIVGAQLKVNRAALIGTNPFTTLGACQVDIRSGGFNGNTALETTDFQAAATTANVAQLTDGGANTDWSIGVLNASGCAAINKTGKTQLRIAFVTGDNNNATSDYLGYCPGEYSDLTRRPKLVISWVDTTPPAIPIGLSVTSAMDTQASLSWTANTEPDLAGYNLYRSTVLGSGYAKVNGATITGTSYTDSGLTNGKTYYYKISALDNVTPPNESAQSAAVTAIIVDTTPPAIPTGLTVTSAANQQVVLDWNDNTEPDLAGYYIYRSTNSGTGYIKLNANLMTASAFTDNGAANNKTYYYKITAVDNAPSPNESAKSGYVTATVVDTIAPAQPTAFTAGPGDAQVVLTWTNPTDSDFAGIQIQRKTNGFPTSPTDGWTGYTGTTGTSWTNGSLVNGVTYYYTIFAKDDAPVPNWSAVSSAVHKSAMPVKTLTVVSVAAEDGWVLESTETSNTGGSSSATMTDVQGTRVGDSASKQQYKGVYSFDSSSLPDTCTIVTAELQLNRGQCIGTNPFTTHGACKVDIRTGGFNGNLALENADFQAAATTANVATMSNPTTDNSWSTGAINSTGLTKINKTGKTQLRVYFNTDDDNDATGDYIGFCPGDYSDTTRRPKLVITYY